MRTLGSIFAKLVAKSGNTRPSTNEIPELYPKILKLNKDGNYYKAIQGYRADIDIVARSKMEANVYRFYKYKEAKNNANPNSAKMYVNHESEIIPFPKSSGVGWYIPDIILTTGTTKLYIEVKGVFTQRTRQIHKAIKTYYPRLMLGYITPETYRLIWRDHADKIPNWEY